MRKQAQSFSQLRGHEQELRNLMKATEKETGRDGTPRFVQIEFEQGRILGQDLDTER